MLLGARQFFERRGGGGWQNPYVTDGLIAMWDGEWNSGLGIHSPRLTIWRNLAGDSRLDIDISGMTIAENYISTGRVLSPPTEAIIPYTDFTFETVGCVSAWPEGTLFSNRFLWLGEDEVGIGLTSGWGSLLFRRYNTNLGDWVITSSSTWGTDYSELYKVRAYSGVTKLNGDYVVYFNGTALPYSSWKPAAGSFDITKLNALRVGQNKGQFSNIIYNTRLYNRALTVEEIAYNHEIDKARFNLP